MMKFEDFDLMEDLYWSNEEDLNKADFGIVKLDEHGRVIGYNHAQEEISGVTKSFTLNKNFFRQIAPCTRIFQVAGQFATNDVLDETFDFTFTQKMQPTMVRLRLLKDQWGAYLLVKRLQQVVA